jgi:CPA2 family monovalent cation:H+ antiporter-2
MTEIVFLQDMLILLALALANAWLFSRLKQSPIIGYLATGMLVGPFGFHLIQGLHEVEVLAEIGVILLLFTIGLEFPFARILRLRRLMLIGGTAQVALSIPLIWAAGRFLGLSNGAAWALGMALALSSTAIVLKLLLEQGEMDTLHGRVSLSILLVQDLCVVFFLVLLPFLSKGAGKFSWLAIVNAIGLMVGLSLFVRYLLKPLLRGVLRASSPELFRLTLLTLVLGTAWVTSLAGFSLALGAFLAGLFLAESDYSHQAMADILPFRDTFLAIFFVSMGMLVDVRMLAYSWHLVLGFLLILSLLKIGTAGLAALLTRCPLRVSLAAGLILFQVGEFSFVLLKQASGLGLIDPQPYQLALSVIALSMVVTPLLVPRAPAVAAAFANLLGHKGGKLEAETLERTANLEGHVIIVGYGLSGQNVGGILRAMQIPYLFIELNSESVRKGNQAGEFIVYGDATAPPVLEGLGIKRARALVLAVNDPGALSRAIRAGRELNPELYILARTRYRAELDYLCELGADEVIPDELEASLQLSNYLLRRFGIAEGQIMQHLTRLRRAHYSQLYAPRQGSSTEAPALSVLEGGQVEFQAVPGDSPCLDRTLAELAFRSNTGAMVLGVLRHERTIYNVSPDFQLKQGDTLILLGSEEEIQRAREMLHGICPWDKTCE